MKSRSLRHQIIFGLTGIVFIIISGIFLSQSMLINLERDMQRRIAIDMDMLAETNEMLLISEEMQRLSLQAAIELDEDLLLNAAMVSNRFFERSEKLRILLGTEGAHFVSSPLISKVDTLEADYRSLIALALPVLAAQIENQKLDKSIFAHIRSAGHAFKSNIELFHRDITYHINEEAAEINVYIERSLHIGFIIIGFVIIMLIIAFIFIDRRLVEPMRSIADFLGRISADPVHANERLAHIHNNEIGKISIQINKLLDQLHKTAVSRDYVDGIVGSMRGALFILTPDFVIRDVNYAACRLLNCSISDLRGKKIFDFTKATDFPQIIDSLLGELNNYRLMPVGSCSLR